MSFMPGEYEWGIDSKNLGWSYMKGRYFFYGLDNLKLDFFLHTIQAGN